MYWIGIVNLLAAVQAFLFAILFLERKELASRLLAIICFCFAIAIAGSVLAALGYYTVFPHFIRVGDPLMLVIPPLIFFYSKKVCKQPLSLRDLVHLLPFFVYLLLLIPFYLQPASKKIEMVETVFSASELPPGILIISVLRLVISATYLILSTQAVHKYNVKLKNSFSTIEFDVWKLALKLLTGFIGAQVILFLLLISNVLNFLQVNIWGGLILSLMLYITVIFGWKKRTTAPKETINTESGHEDQKPSEKIDTNKRPGEDVSKTCEAKDDLKKQMINLQSFMEKEKPFTNPELSLAGLALLVGTSPHQLSYTINQGFQQNFFDFVNGFRVKEVIALLANPDNKAYTIISLAFEAGFNSKSTFNSAFRKYTGKTPSQFKATDNQQVN